MQDSFSDTIHNQCPRSSSVSRPFTSFYLKKSYFLFFGVGEGARGMRITLKNERESNKTWGRWFDILKEKKKVFSKTPGLNLSSSSGEHKKGNFRIKKPPTAAFASCLATLRALYRSTNRSQNTLLIILKSPKIRMIQKRGV